MTFEVWWFGGMRRVRGVTGVRGREHVDKIPGANDRGGVDSSLRESSGRPSASAFSASLYSGMMMEVSSCRRGCALASLRGGGRCWGGETERQNGSTTAKMISATRTRMLNEETVLVSHT